MAVRADEISVPRGRPGAVARLRIWLDREPVLGPVFVMPALLLLLLLVAYPFVIALYFGKYVLKMRAPILLGACAGGRTTTAALGAIQDAAGGSKVPALGYTVTYAVGNTLLTIWGVVVVLLTK